MKKLDWKPTTLDECMTALSEMLSPEDQMKITMMSKSDLIVCHHGLDRWIRNNWDLWQGGPLLEHMQAMGFTHPDDISMTIIKEWWARMNKAPSSLQEDLKHYTEYWSQQNET